MWKQKVKTLTDDSATEFAKIQQQNHQFFFDNQIFYINF